MSISTTAASAASSSLTKEIPKGKFLKVIYENFKVRVIDVSASILVPRAKVFCSYYDDKDETYCRCVGNSNKQFRISFGGGTVRSALGLSNSATPVTVAKAKFGDAVKTFKALYYHEIGHLRYTDMSCFDIINYPVEAERWSLSELFNIFEDIVIERFGMAKDYPYTRRYFSFLEEAMFDSKAMSAYNDDGTASQFFNFLLLRMRRGKAFTGSNKLFSDNETDMVTHIKSILGETNSTERIKKTIAFFEYLKSLGLKMDIPEGSKVSSSSAVPFGVPASTSGGGSGKGNGGGISPISTSPDSSSVDDAASGGGSPSGSGGGAGGVGGSGASSPEDDSELDLEADAPVVENDCYESFNQVLFSDDAVHAFYDMDYFNPDGVVEHLIDTLLCDVAPEATAIATVIKTYQSRNRLMYHSGKSSGKLHVPSAIAGKPVNIFKKKERSGLIPDLAISVLCDNSGSMAGEKSEICTRAMLSLAAACSKCNVPIEINAFTECGEDGASTFRIKKFSDKLDVSKKYFGITSYQLYRHYHTALHMFSGNTDEVNLYNVWQEFRKQPWRDKVVIVISDGETCGSTDDLRKVSDAMLADGVYVLGVGVCDGAVNSSYEHCKVFGSSEELKEFPAWLGGLLIQLIKG